MANKLKGEVAFTAGDRGYTLVYTIDALIALEEHFGQSVQELGAMLQENLRMKDLRILFHAGLQARHPDVDVVEAGRVMSELGLTDCGGLIGRAFTLAFATGKEKASAAGPQPAGAQDGIGLSSSVSTASSASEALPTSSD